MNVLHGMFRRCICLILCFVVFLGSFSVYVREAEGAAVQTTVNEVPPYMYFTGEGGRDISFNESVYLQNDYWNISGKVQIHGTNKVPKNKIIINAYLSIRTTYGAYNSKKSRGADIGLYSGSNKIGEWRHKYYDDNYTQTNNINIINAYLGWYKGTDNNDVVLKIDDISPWDDVSATLLSLKVKYEDPAEITSVNVVNEKRVDIRWENTGRSYRLYRNNNLIYEGTSNSYIDTGVSPGGTYKYKVETLYSNQVASSSLKTIKVPPAPPTLKVQTGGLNWSNDVVERGKGYIVLNWDKLDQATGYKIWVFDGYQYRVFDVGNVNSWDSRVWKIWPDMKWLNNQGNNTITDDIFNRNKGGGDLPDNPNLLYKKTSGTTYDSRTNYWFKISTYNNYGESLPGSIVTPTIPNRTDSIKPVVNNVILNDGVYKTGSNEIKVQIDAYDEGGSGIKTYQVSTDNSVWRDYANNVIPNYIIPAGSGQKDVYVRVKDVAGNISNTFKTSIYLKDDNDAPKIELSINNGMEYTLERDVILTINAYDDLTPIEKLQMRFSEDGINWTSWERLAFIKNWRLSDGKGIKRVFMQVIDSAGNIATTGSTISYYDNESEFMDENKKNDIDKENPVIISFKVSNGVSIVTGSSIRLSIIANDNSGIENLEMCFSDESMNWSSPVKYVPNYTLNKTLKQGMNTIYVKVIDSAGNSAIADLEVFKK